MLLNVPFRRNGRDYVIKYAWTPIKTYQGEWIWFGVYFVLILAPGNGQKILSPMDFITLNLYG